MNKRELDQRIEGARDVVKPAVGDKRFLAIVPGTGWGDGLGEIFEPEKKIHYGDLRVPGAESVVEGHSKTMQIGRIGDRPVIVMGRVHVNESTDPNLVLAMRIVIESVRDSLDGIVVTNGVGSLHGHINQHLGWLTSAIHTAVLNASAYIHTGRRSEIIGTGDLAVADGFDTTTVGRDTPLLSGEFVDWHNDGYHREKDRYFELGRDAVLKGQGQNPRARVAFMHGPQFEDIPVKIAARARGCDVIGMSGLEGLAATNTGIPFSHLVLVTNGPFAPHSHEGNQEVGKSRASTAGFILRLLSETWPRKL
jgi:purine nucleoside phosphorylase